MLYIMVFGVLYSLQLLRVTVVDMVMTNIFRRHMEITLSVLIGEFVCCLPCLCTRINQELIRYNLFVSFITRNNVTLERNMVIIILRRITEH